MDGNPAADPEINPDAVARLPVHVWTFTMSNSKKSRIATHARRHRRARARNPNSGRRFKVLQVMFPSRRVAEGRDPPPVNLIYQALVRAYPASPRMRPRRTIRPVDRTTERRRSDWRMCVANAWYSSSCSLYDRTRAEFQY